MTDSSRSLVGTFLVVLGSLFVLVGLATGLYPIFNGQNINGILVGLAGTALYLVFGGGLVTFGVGLDRRRQERLNPGIDLDGNRITRLGITLTLASIATGALLLGVLLIFASGIQSST